MLLDVTYDAAINSWIYNPTKEKAFADNTLFAKIEGNIFKMTVNELLVDGALNVDAVMDIIFDGIYLGNAMKYAIEAFEAAPVDAREDKTFTEVVKAYGELPVASYLLEEGFYYVQEMDEYYFLVEEEGVYHKKTISVTDERKLEYGEITPESYTKDHLGYVWRKEGKPVSVLYNLIANTDLGTLVNGGTITLIEDLDWLTISDVGLSNSNKVIDLISDTPLCKIANKIDEIVLADLMGYNMSEVHNLDGYADVTGFAGVVMTNASGEYVRKIGDTWYEADATLATRKDGIAKAADYTLKLTSGTPATEVGMLKAMFGSLTIKDVTNGGGIDDIMDSVTYLTLSEVLGENNSLFNDKIFGKLKNTVIKDLGNDVNAMVLGDLMDYTLTEVTDVTGYTDVIAGVVMKNASDEYVRLSGGKWYKASATIAGRKLAASETVSAEDYTFVWDKDGATVGVSDGVLASLSIGEVLGGTSAILDRMFWLSANELLGISGTSKIFSLIGDKPIKDIEDSINELYVGDLMGYTRGDETAPGSGEYKWFEDAGMTKPVKGFEDIIANVTVGGISGPDISAKIQNVKLRDILPANASGSILDDILDQDTEGDYVTISNATTKVPDRMKVMSIETFMNRGIITISDQDAIDTIFETQIAANKYEYPTGKTDWKQLTMDEFINALLTMLS